MNTDNKGKDPDTEDDEDDRLYSGLLTEDD